MLSYSCSAYGIAILIVSFVNNRVDRLASTSNVGLPETESRHFSKLIQAIKTVTNYGLRFLAISVLCYNLYRILIVMNLLNVAASESERPQLSSFTLNLNSPWLTYNSSNYASDSYMAPKYFYTEKLVGPNSDIYWPIFLGFCLSVFVEGIISTSLGTKLYIDSSMSLFEVSSALHECSGSSFFLVQNALKPTEVALMLCLFQTFSHLNVQIGDLINKNRYRLVGLTILNLGFIAFVIRSWLYGNFEELPVILMTSTFPQILMLLVVSISVGIFFLALLMNGFNLRRLNFGSLLLPSTFEMNEVASENVRGIKALNLNLDDDFLTALLGIGLFAVTLAGKSSYITELRLVVLRQETWIEASLWDSIKAQVESIASDKSGPLPRKALINYLRENHINGYANIITKPSRRLLSGEYQYLSSNGDPANLLDSKKTSIFRKRIIYLKRIYRDFFQLLKGITGKFYRSVVTFFYIHVLRQKPSESQRNRVETDEEFELRKKSVPEFLRQYVKRETPVAVTPEVVVSEEWLETNYASLLQGQEVLEFDDSADYVDEQEYSESDFSDIESIDVSQAGQGSLAINELMTSEGVEEFFQESMDNSIFKVHMSKDHEASGIMTRSKYKKLTSIHEDETSKLIELILHKRSYQLDEIYQGKTPAIPEDYEPTQYCVICQCNAREIITWPCRCFAICEDCRISLVSKGMEGCVCCRREVEGISKIFVP